MNIRNAIPEMWDEQWFKDLSPNAKLIFCYIRDKADDAGFIDFDETKWNSHLKLDLSVMRSAVVEIWKRHSKVLLPPKESGHKCIWLKKHLKWQGKLPLTNSTAEGRWIIERIKEQMYKFANDQKHIPKEFLDILENIETGNGKKSRKNIIQHSAQVKIFIPPTIKEWSDYWITQHKTSSELEIKNAHDHYVTVGWTVGRSRKQMKDWQGAVRTCINNKITKDKGEIKQTKLENLVEENKKIKEFDFNTLKK